MQIRLQAVSKKIWDFLSLNWSPKNGPLPWRLRFLVTCVIIAIATFLQLLLWPYIEPSTFIFFYPAIALAALYGDGLSAIFLSALASQYFFIASGFSFASTWKEDLVRMTVFVLSALLLRQMTVRLAEALRHAKKEKERADIQEKELLLKSEALENSLNGFDIVDENGNFVYVNRAYLSMWGYETLEEVMKTSPADHCADPETPRKIITLLKRNGECEIEFVAKRKDGTTFDVRMWARLAHDSAGNEVYPSTSIDVTERKMIESKLKESKETAEKANRAKSQFLANMSHEIRTPIGVIQGFADLLNESSGLQGDQQQWVETIRRNASLLTRVIGEILDLSRVEADKLEIERVVFSLPEVMEEIKASMFFKAEEKGLLLSLDSDTDVPQLIKSDPTRLRQVLINLIGNAIKFTEKGKVSVKFTRDPKESQVIKVLIEDTGIGLSEEHRKKIFEPFVQADSSMTRRFGGTGLGLAISKRLAKALGGDLKLVSSEPGKGTSFVLSFCCIFDDNEKLAAMNRPISLQKFDLSKKQILLVEDSPDNQLLIRRFLTSSGAQVTTANNGREGADKAKNQKFDLILLDIQMPVMDGYEALAQMQADGVKIPIVALTAHALREERERALRAGFTDYLTKPVSKNLLLEKVHILLLPKVRELVL